MGRHEDEYMKWFYEKLQKTSRRNIEEIKIIESVQMRERDVLRKRKSTNLASNEFERIHVCKHDENLPCKTLRLK